MAPASKAQQKAVAKYMKANYDEIKIRVSKGKKETITDYAQKQGKSLNGYINEAIDAKIERDKKEPPADNG